MSLYIKKIFLLSIIFIAFSTPCLALEPVSVQLGVIETSLWGFQYKKENEQTRIKRIEDTVFGESGIKGTVQERINRVNQTLGLESDEIAANTQKELEEIESANVKYPVIDKLETEFLKQNFPKDTIYVRLERLEMRMYGAKQSGELNDRVNKLVASSSGAKYFQQDESGYYSYKKPSQSMQQSMQQSFDMYDSDAHLQIAGLENSIFGKTYGQEPINTRLSRLEKKIFQRDFMADDEFTRLQRLQAASTARNTSKYYDSNKLQKYTSTGIQIGTFLLMILAFIL